MRLPLYFVIPICIFVPVLAFWLLTMRMDFVTPPPEERLLTLQAALQEKHRPINVERFVPEEPKKREPIEAPAPIETAPNQQFDPALAEIAPALDEYVFEASAENGYAGLLEIARPLEEQGFHQRALLAWERILDTAAAPPNVHRQALQSVARLRTIVGPWTVDESEIVPLDLQAGATSIDTSTLSSTMESLAQLIEQSSAGTIDLDPKLTVSGSVDSTRVLPVAIWLSQRGSNENQTAVLTFTPTSDDPAFVSRAVSTIVYELVKGTLNKTGRFRPLPNLVAGENPDDLLRTRITRLQWRTFAQLLTPASEEVTAEGN